MNGITKGGSITAELLYNVIGPKTKTSMPSAGAGRSLKTNDTQLHATADINAVYMTF